MHSTSIRHADLVIDFDSEGWVQITRQSNAQTVQLSKSEWVFLLKCSELRGWPTVPPGMSLRPDYLAPDMPNQGIP
jgi:hypothetical protein